MPSRLAQERVKISVLIVARAGERRQELRAASRRVRGKGDGFAQRIGVPRDERRDLRLVFRLEDRARRIQEGSAVRKTTPQRVDEPRLLAREAFDIGFPPQPFDIGMTSNDARGGARNIRKDAIEGPAVPPCFRGSGIAGSDFQAPPRKTKALASGRRSAPYPPRMYGRPP